MADHVDFLLFMIFISANYRMADAEDCALASNLNKTTDLPKMTMNGRRRESNYTDILNPEVKFILGITYPPGAFTHKGYTVSKKGQVTGPLHTPPTNFFPLGSSRVTITLPPWPLMYIHPHSQKYNCDYFIRSCIRAYDTGSVCAHALHGTTKTFLNYCALEYTNCLMKTNLWQVAYFGDCALARIPDSGKEFDIEGDNFLESAIINLPPFNPLTGQEISVFN